MKTLSGISAAPGIAIGKVFIYSHETPAVPRYGISSNDVAREMERFRAAAEKARSELRDIRKQGESEMDDDQLAILDSHLLMMEDQDFHEQVEAGIIESLMNVEWVLYQSVQRLLDKLNSSESEELRERSSDVHDVTSRVLNHLMQRERFSLADLSEEVILVAHDLMPSDAIVMNKRMVRGIATDAGGRTSHTAILARSFEIPSVLGLSEVSRMAEGGETIIVDGNHGTITLSPDEDTLARYESESQEWHRHEVQLMRLHDLPAETRDGKLIALKANIEVPDEVESVVAHGGDGIGLYRSEFLFLGGGKLPSEEQQLRAYRHVLEALPGKPVTIRTLDVGGDKVAPQLEDMDEQNPILGWRAIRFCLSNRDIFRTQLRALLRSSLYGDLRIMFPMISGLEELVEATDFLREVRDELRREGVEVAPDVSVGTMIEVPSAAMVSDILARKSSFFSVGTNDLIQYTIAVDRGNERIAYLYEPFHPGVLRMLRLVVDNGHANGIPVAMCGEMAADPLATVLLLGLGFDELSMSAGSIPEVKRIVRSVSVAEAEEVVGEAMEMNSFKEVDRYLRHLMGDRFGVATV
ncbi:MAG: phosphoenolpyruvate--protein phosphotransferase [Spirochaetota bacterium]